MKIKLELTREQWFEFLASASHADENVIDGDRLKEFKELWDKLAKQLTPSENNP